MTFSVSLQCLEQGVFMVKNIYLKTLDKDWLHIVVKEPLTEILWCFFFASCIKHWFKIEWETFRRLNFWIMSVPEGQWHIWNDITLQNLTRSFKKTLSVAAAHCCGKKSPWKSQAFGPPSKGRKSHLTWVSFLVSQVVHVLSTSEWDLIQTALTVIE